MIISRLLAGFFLCSFTVDAFAFQKCPTGTSPCSTPLQFFSFIVVPAILAGILGIYIRRRVQRAWVRRTALVALGLFWFVSLLVVIGAFGLFLAPCEAVCWSLRNG